MSAGVARASLVRAALRAGVLAALALGSAGASAAERFGDVEVSLVPAPSCSETYESPRGYAEFRFVITNRSSQSDHTVRLVYPAHSFSSRGRIREISRTVRVARGGTVEAAFFQPSVGVEGGGVAVEIDGRRQNDQIGTAGYGSRYDPRRLGVLVSRGVPTEVGDGLASGGTSDTTVLVYRSEVPVSDWSRDWLGYSRYIAVILTRADLDGLSPEVKAAMRRYVECGGAVLVHDGTSIPDYLAQGAKADGRVLRVGFGRVALGSDVRTEEFVRAGTLAWPWPGSTTDSEFVFARQGRVPVRGMFALVLIFALAIGPLNIWLLTRKKRRIWLLWNVPAVSLVTCLAIFLYSVFSEGWTPLGHAAGLTVLDEGRHRATTLGLMSFYSPLTPSGGLRFDYETEVLPQGDSGDAPKTIDWTTGQHLSGGWVTARTPAAFTIRKSQDRRERLSLRRSADPGAPGLVAVNGLGVRIQELHVADERGRVFTAFDLPAGAERTLAPTTKTTGNRGAPRLLGEDNWLAVIEDMRRNPAAYLEPGRYVAVVDRSPFLETPLSGAQSLGGPCVVYGISKGEGDGR